LASFFVALPMAAAARAANSGIGIPTPPFRPDHITPFAPDRGQIEIRSTIFRVTRRRL
jgi:hypothetical protein